MLRTRELISLLNYDSLVESGVIPTLSLPELPKRRYPPVIYTTEAFSFFGMFMDYVVRKAIRSRYPEASYDLGEDCAMELCPIEMAEYNSDLDWKDCLFGIHRIVCALYKEAPYEFTKDLIPWIRVSISGVLEALEPCKEFTYNAEMKCTLVVGSEKINVQAHPDIVTETAVLEIKNTGSFSSMFKSSVLQALTYFAILRAHGNHLKRVSFVLPVQKTVISYDLSTWDYMRYLQTLPAFMVKRPKVITIGAHVPKEDNLAKSLVANPCQMFLRAPTSGKIAPNTKSQISEAGKKIKDESIRYFTHAAYCINLCAGLPKGQSLLNEDLDFTVLMNGEGVVVHVGKSCKKTMEDAMDNMETMVRVALGHATEKCKLLIETPAGMGTEVCTSIEDLQMFFTRFSDEERKKLGVCVDTCHVFAAGYDPLEYLIAWESCGVPICLVHYNDSKKERGSRLDRHATVGTGFIGMETMQQVAVWCNARDIPMVVE